MYYTDGICEDAFQIGSRCYKVYKEWVPWFTAVNRCLSNNATLAIFDENVRQIPSSVLPRCAWIGLIKSWWTWADSGQAKKLHGINLMVMLDKDFGV